MPPEIVQTREKIYINCRENKRKENISLGLNHFLFFLFVFYLRVSQPTVMIYLVNNAVLEKMDLNLFRQ